MPETLYGYLKSCDGGQKICGEFGHRGGPPLYKAELTMRNVPSSLFEHSTPAELIDPSAGGAPCSAGIGPVNFFFELAMSRNTIKGKLNTPIPHALVRFGRLEVTPIPPE